MPLRTLLPLVLVLAIMAQIPRPHQISPRPDEEVPLPLPNGQIHRDEILKADYEKSLNDVRELAKLAEDLKTDLEKTDRFSISLATVKKTEEIEKLAKRIRVRIKRF